MRDLISHILSGRFIAGLVLGFVLGSLPLIVQTAFAAAPLPCPGPGEAGSVIVPNPDLPPGVMDRIRAEAAIANLASGHMTLREALTTLDERSVDLLGVAAVNIGFLDPTLGEGAIDRAAAELAAAARTCEEAYREPSPAEPLPCPGHEAECVEIEELIDEIGDAIWSVYTGRQTAAEALAGLSEDARDLAAFGGAEALAAVVPGMVGANPNLTIDDYAGAYEAARGVLTPPATEDVEAPR